MRATVVGDFSKIGLPDIDSTNVTDIIGTSNGRGIYVIFDADGSIMQNFFGAGDGILGISSRSSPLLAQPSLPRVSWC